MGAVDEGVRVELRGEREVNGQHLGESLGGVKVLSYLGFLGLPLSERLNCIKRKLFNGASNILNTSSL